MFSGLLHAPTLDPSTPTQLCFLFHPFLVASCAAKTSTGLHNLVLALFLLCLLTRWRLPATALLALATYHSLYPAMLLVPLCLAFLNETDYRKPLMTVLPVLALFALFLSGLLYASYVIMGGSWTFLGATYGFILSVPELTPTPHVNCPVSPSFTTASKASMAAP